ncbi:MAG: YmdB family metallophosphoesterase [Holosporales bacterium]|jgi:metallophosphoesterase (TIGR00282 family)|nr:YmdB family metallophosphoesterase [Holosporales bacterium]
MRIAFFGDVVGKCGRNAAIEYIRTNRVKYGFDFIIVNGENAAHGFGITQRICDKFFEVGVDVITLGNHSFDQKDDLAMFERERRLIRPLNYPRRTPGRGFVVADAHGLLGRKVMVVNVMGRLFMEENDDPFVVMTDLLSEYKLTVNVDAIFVDCHAEATAEKTALARYFDGKISALIGTHTHAPTADLQILSRGTGFLSDCGMCGDYDSCIGMDDESPIKRFTSKVDAYAKMIPAQKEATVCGVVVDVGNNGLCSNIQTIRVGGFLKEQKDCLGRF